MTAHAEAVQRRREKIRVAVVGGDVAASIKAYLPGNYEIVTERVVWDSPDGYGVVIAGVDECGWTLDDYVIPRLASGLYFAKEVTPAEAAGDEPLEALIENARSRYSAGELAELRGV